MLQFFQKIEFDKFEREGGTFGGNPESKPFADYRGGVSVWDSSSPEGPCETGLKLLE